MAKRQDVKMVWTHGKKGSDDAFFVRAVCLTFQHNNDIIN